MKNTDLLVSSKNLQSLFCLCVLTLLLSRLCHGRGSLHGWLLYPRFHLDITYSEMSLFAYHSVSDSSQYYNILYYLSQNCFPLQYFVQNFPFILYIAHCKTFSLHSISSNTKAIAVL